MQGEERIQYYHRYVFAYLLGEKSRLLLDLEMQQPGEAEIIAAALAIRVVALYPLLKFVLAAVVALPGCFALSHLIRQIPYMERVL